jgi:hypothetical protein
MKFVIPLVIALATMAAAAFIVTVFFKIDLKGEIGKLLPTDELPELPVPEPTVDPAV